MILQPSTAIPLRLNHVAAGLHGIRARHKIASFERAFASFIGTRHAIAVGNGTTALYVALLAMKHMRPERNEVVLPAYTVPTLTLAFNAAGLKTRLCDVDRGTFNAAPASMTAAVTRKTLAMIPVHMFGFPCAMDEILEAGRTGGVFVLEDACQAPGARLGGKRVGSIGDCGIFSFCKGKNISTFHGGMVTTDDDELAGHIRSHVDTLPPRSLLYRAATPMVLSAFSFAMRPSFYAQFFPVIEKFKSTRVHQSFHPTVYNGFMAGVGNAILPVLDRWNGIRREYGRRITEILAGDDGLIIPEPLPDAEPVYNHVPVVFRERTRMERTQKALFDRGIDTGRMYEKPIHHIYSWLDYPRDPDPFPEATFIAPRLLTLPSHPYLNDYSVDLMTATVHGYA